MLPTRALLLALLVTAALVAAPSPALAVTSGAQHADSGVSGTAGAETPLAVTPADVDDEPGTNDTTDDAGADDPDANGTSTNGTSTNGTNETFDHVDEDDDPSTNGTIGYVEGISYDEELPVDDREDAVLEADELEAVVHRSMARVEVLRERPFEDDIDVEVVSREEFAEENARTFENLSDEERRFENVRFEALFMVDRETDAVEEYRALYDDAVLGYYDPEADEIVLVSDDPEEPRLDEVTLGHELVHALQDQYFDLGRFDRETLDGRNAENGLIEGDAVRVETAYADRCADEWDCLAPAESPDRELDDGVEEGSSEFNWGIYFTIYQPYSDGPAYVEHLREEGGWDAVDAAYDDPPASSSAVISPGEEREPTEVDLEDTSSEEWTPLAHENATMTDTVGEAAMVSMLSQHSFDRSTGSSVVPLSEFVATDQEGYIDAIEYEQPYTNGWAGDEFVAYVGDAETVEETGYVWRSEWRSPEGARTFADGYLELLAINGANPVDGYRDTFVIESDYPGAYYVGVDDETVTVVHAPTVEELSEIRAGAAPDGENVLEFEEYEAETDDEVGGFGVAAALLAVLVVAASRRHRR